MSNTVRSDIAFKPLNGSDPSTIYELVNGDLIAVHFAATRTSVNSLDCYIAAWLVDGDGDPQANVDSAGVPVLVEFRHNAPMREVTALGAQGIASAMLALVLGDTPTDPPVIPWGDSILSEVNIQNAIAMARATSELIDLTPGVSQ